MTLRLITAPEVMPVSLAELKQHLRVNHDDEDELIEALGNAATQYADGKDGWLGRALVPQTWELVLDEFPSTEILIPLPPLISVISVAYDDGDGIEQTVSSADYTVDNTSEPGWVIPNSDFEWPTTLEAVNAVRVRFIAGYEESDDSPVDMASGVPQSIKSAIKLLVGTMYAHRESVIVGVSAIEMPWATEALLRPYRVRLGMA